MDQAPRHWESDLLLGGPKNGEHYVPPPSLYGGPRSRFVVASSQPTYYELDLNPSDSVEFRAHTYIRRQLAMGDPPCYYLSMYVHESLDDRDFVRYLWDQLVTNLQAKEA